MIVSVCEVTPAHTFSDFRSDPVLRSPLLVLSSRIVPLTCTNGALGSSRSSCGTGDPVCAGQRHLRLGTQYRPGLSEGGCGIKAASLRTLAGVGDGAPMSDRREDGRHVR